MIRYAVWTASLIDLLADLDVAEKAARQAIMRTADSGWIEASRVGRETRWNLTAAGTRLLREGTDRIYGFAAEERTARAWSQSGLDLAETGRRRAAVTERGNDPCSLSLICDLHL